MDIFYVILMLIYLTVIVELYCCCLKKMKNSRGGKWKRLVRIKNELIVIPVWPIAVLYHFITRNKKQPKKWDCK